MNNLKQIRELFGYSQEEVAHPMEVSRATVSKWENGELKVSRANLEKLSLLFCIGPEFFFEKALTPEAIERITSAGKRIREHDKKDSDGIKYHDVIKELNQIDSRDLIRDYFLTTKLLLIKAEELENSQLDDLVNVNEKLGVRLQKIQEIRKKSKNQDDSNDFLNELIEKYDSKVIDEKS